MKDIVKRFDMFKLAVKYWLQGDNWPDATAYAKRIVYGFKRG